jgi:predicted ATPase
MRLHTLSIKNFRGVSRGDLRFRPHNVFVGPNNCGKTTVVEALALLFGRDRLVRALTEHDFYGGSPAAADRIRLTANIIGFKGNDPGHYTDWFSPERAVPKWIDRETLALMPEPKDATSILTCQLGFAARFDRPSLEAVTARYFVDDEEADVLADDHFRSIPARLLREMGFYLVPASRTWDRTLSFGSELFRRVVTSGRGLPSEAVLHERDRLRTPERPVEADPQIEPIVSELNKEMRGFFDSAPALRLRVTSTDSDGVLDAMVPHFALNGQDYAIPARRHGTGLVSMQSLMLLLQFGKRRADAGEGFWMALEEPELHIPPPLQRRLVQRLQSLSSQTFMTSHSPTVAGMSDVRALQVLRNNGGVLTAVPMGDAASRPDDPNTVRRLFELHRQHTIATLMHDAVLIPEGTIDGEWLELIAAAVDSKHSWDTTEESRFSARVGVIRTQDAAVLATYRRLFPLHPRVNCLLDGDSAGAKYLEDLVDEPIPPARVLQWPKDWAIENVVGWLAEADTSVLNSIGQIGVPVQTPAHLVERLRSADRAAGGLKQNRLVYEAIAEALAENPAVLSRARQFLNAVADEAIGVNSTLFSDQGNSTDKVAVRTFHP